MDLKQKISEAYLSGQEDMRRRAAEVPQKLGNNEPKIDAFLKDIGATISRHIKDIPLKEIGE